MRSLVIIALFFFVNSSFLRDLGKVTISGATLGTECVEKAASIALNLTLTASAEFNSTDDGEFQVVLSGGNNTISSECTLENNTVFTCTDALTNPAAGTYTLKSLTETSTSAASDVNTYEFADSASVAFMIAETVALAAEQETAQTVDLKDNNKKTFKIALDANATVTEVPAVFAGNDAKIPLSACTLNKEDKVVTCSPTKDEMEDGEKYKIYYNKGCTKTDTKIEVTFKNGSTFMTVSKIALITFALLF